MPCLALTSSARLDAPQRTSQKLHGFRIERTDFAAEAEPAAWICALALQEMFRNRDHDIGPRSREARVKVFQGHRAARVIAGPAFDHVGGGAARLGANRLIEALEHGHLRNWRCQNIR